jgi:hypothetical protein
VKRVLYAKDASFDHLVSESVSEFLVNLQKKESFTHIVAAATSLPKVSVSFYSSLDPLILSLLERIAPCRR